ncbi:MAG: beta-galactosidase, partial [Lentisphaeria bacterium]|nr:beta-galactosidase [Lentisphaeria bacterium]
GVHPRDVALEFKSLKKTDNGYELALVKPVKFALPAGAVVRQHTGLPPFNAGWRRMVGGRWTQFARRFYPLPPGAVTGRIFVQAPKGTRVRFRDLGMFPIGSDKVVDNAAVRARHQLPLYFAGKGKPVLTPDGGTAWAMKPQDSLRRTDLRKPAALAEQIEALVTADTPGMLGIFIHGFDGKKNFVIPRATPVIPDGKPHWVIVHPRYPSPDSVVTAVDLGWRNNWGGTVRIEKVRVLGERNFIPGADTVPRNTPVELDYLWGGREYRLCWTDGGSSIDRGESPGTRIAWLDSDDRELGVTELPAGKAHLDFTPPASAVRGVLTVAPGGVGLPVLHELRPAAADNWQGEWIWSQLERGPENTTVWFEREFELAAADVVRDAAVFAAADDRSWIYVNGHYAGEGGNHHHGERRDVAKFLKPGKNRLTIRVRNDAGYGMLLANMYIELKKGGVRLVTDGKWKFACGGDDAPPARIDRPAVVIAPAAEKNKRLNPVYIGPRTKLELRSAVRNSFTARVVRKSVFSPRVPEDLPGVLQYRLVPVGGGEARRIMLATGVSKDGDTYRFEYTPPFLLQGGKFDLFLDDDRVYVAGDERVGEVAVTPPAPAGLASARYEFDGGRIRLRVGGRLMTPFFWKFPGNFPRSFAGKGDQILAAHEAGFDNVALSTDFPKFWLAPEKFDFSNLDAQVEQVLSINPDAVLMIQIGCYMPDWWLDANPDDTAAREDGSPRDRTYERQALSSQKWLRDARIPLAAFVEHVKRSPYADRVWAVNVAENTNLEWFWWNGSRYRGDKPFFSGFSPADTATFRRHLKRKYSTDAALAQAWKQPGVTLDTAEMPRAAEINGSHFGALLDPERDQRVGDWFEYRNASLGEAFISLCRDVKELSGGKWLAGGYFGYFFGLAGGSGHPIHDVGHNSFLEVARSPYVDFVRSPAQYGKRRLGMSDGNSIPFDTFLGRHKVAYVEFDLRSALKEDPAGYGDVPVARPATLRQNFDIMNRTFGMVCATGCAYYWYDITSGAYLHPAYTALFRKQMKLYTQLPPVRGTTPTEIMAVGDRDSIYYTRRNNGKDAVLEAAMSGVLDALPYVGAPFGIGCTDDLLEPGVIPPRRFYILCNAWMLPEAKRAALLKRFEAELATVLWLYAAGPILPGRSPSVENMEKLLGIKFRIDRTVRRPKLVMAEHFRLPDSVSARKSAPWFVPVSGFDEVLGRDENGAPALVEVRRNGATHLFSTLPNLRREVVRELAKRAGVRLYTPDVRDPAWIGGDLVFIHAATPGTKRVSLPPGTKLKRLLGALPKDEFDSDETWEVEAGRTYGFEIVRK